MGGVYLRKVRVYQGEVCGVRGERGGYERWTV